MKFDNYEDFIKFENPVKFKEKFECIGYFPYEKAQIRSKDATYVPVYVFKDIFDTLDIFDNKYVCVFRIINGLGQNFAIQFIDGYAKLGSWNDIEGYALSELRLKKEYLQNISPEVVHSSTIDNKFNNKRNFV